MIFNPWKVNLCLDDGGATGPWTTKYALAAWGSNADHHQFDVLGRKDLLAAVPALPPAMQTGADLMLRVAGKNLRCLDDGGGTTTTGPSALWDWTCNPYSPNQVFKDDTATQQLRSSAKTGLCVDDGGAAVSGAANMTLATCDAKSVNQKFVYNPSTQMFRNVNKNNLCIDDGGATNAGAATSYSLATCDLSSANQKFEIKSMGVLLSIGRVATALIYTEEIMRRMTN